MKDPCTIVILDGHTANPGDLSWSEIEAIGAVTVHPRTATADVVARARDADIVLTNKTVISREAIAALPRLSCIGVLATGYNIVDVEAAKERGIPVCNVPEYSTPNVTQAVFALLLELTNHTGHHAQTVRAGRSSTRPTSPPRSTRAASPGRASTCSRRSHRRRRIHCSRRATVSSRRTLPGPRGMPDAD